MRWPGKLEQKAPGVKHEGHEEPGEPPCPVHDLPDVPHFLCRSGQYFDCGADHAEGPRPYRNATGYRIFRFCLSLCLFPDRRRMARRSHGAAPDAVPVCAAGRGVDGVDRHGRRIGGAVHVPACTRHRRGAGFSHRDARAVELDAPGPARLCARHHPCLLAIWKRGDTAADRRHHRRVLVAGVVLRPRRD